MSITIEMEPTIHKALDIADWFLAFSKLKDKAPLEKMKLQKLLYYAQAHHLAEFGSPLFNEDFEAWEYGPVIDEVWQKVKIGQTENSNYVSLTNDFDFNDFTIETSKYLLSIWNTYANLNFMHLSNKTHKELPWSWHYNKEEEHHSTVIPKSVIENYFLLSKIAVNV